MAYVVDTLEALAKEIKPRPSITPFAANVRSDDISTCKKILGKQGADKRIVLNQVTISSGAAITISVGGDGGGTDLTTHVIGPVPFAANSSMQWTFINPIALDFDTSLACDASAAGLVNILVEGYIV